MKKKLLSLLALCLAASMIFSGTAFASDSDSDDGYAGPHEVVEDKQEPPEDVKTELEPSEDAMPYEGVMGPQETPTPRTPEEESTGGSSNDAVTDVSADTVTEGKEEKEEVKTEYTVEPVQEAPAEASSEGAAVEAVAESVIEADIGMEEEPVIIESGEITYDDEEWPIEMFEGLVDVVTGIQDYEFAEDAGHKYDIHHGVTMNDQEVISSVLFDTSGVDFTTLGTYEITYYVYFHRVMIAGWLDLYDMDHDSYPGVDSNADRIKVTVTATVTVTGA